jgi:glutamate-1-semialdehyde aminotransferase
MKSDELLARAQKHLVEGVGAGGRYHPLLGRALYFSRGARARLWDVDGREYIDFFTGSGANFLGHDHPAIREAIRRALDVGVICNGETEYHARLAELVPARQKSPSRSSIRISTCWPTGSTKGSLRRCG